MKKYFIIFLSIECLCSIGCNTEEQIIANDHFYSKKKLEKLIEKQEEISSLIINNYKDTIFPNEFILKFKKLNSLIIDGGFGQAYPLHIDNDKLSSLKDLHSLSIISFLLDSFPTSFSQFDLLTHLQLSEDYLKNIPPDISKFSKLNYLDVWSNYLTGLPESFKELSQLQIFSINFNQLSAIPSVLKDLPNIQEITLQDSRNIASNGAVGNRIDYENNQLLIEILSKKSVKKVTFEVKDSATKKRIKKYIREKALLKKANILVGQPL